MAKLVLSMDGLVLKEIPLVKERLTIGRKPHNDIQIDNLAISGEHAAIVTILNDSFLEDLNSTNGTQVNGVAIKKHILRNNDLIELGKYRLKYMVAPVGTAPVDADPAAAAAALARTADEMQLAPTASARRTSPGTPAAALARLAAIQVLNGPNAGRELELSKTLTTLGRTGQQMVVIARRANGYFLTHVEGPSYPSLNGRELDAQAHALNDHDVIELAGIKMEFFYKG